MAHERRKNTHAQDYGRSNIHQHMVLYNLSDSQPFIRLTERIDFVDDNNGLYVSQGIYKNLSWTVSCTT